MRRGVSLVSQQQLPPQLLLPAATDSSDGPKIRERFKTGTSSHVNNYRHQPFDCKC